MLKTGARNFSYVSHVDSEAQASGPSSAPFTDALAKAWIKSGATMKQIGPHLGCRYHRLRLYPLYYNTGPIPDVILIPSKPPKTQKCLVLIFNKLLPVMVEKKHLITPDEMSNSLHSETTLFLRLPIADYVAFQISWGYSNLNCYCL